MSPPSAGVVLWLLPGGLVCTLVPFYGRFQLRLTRGDHQLVRSAVFDDAIDAARAAEGWRDELVEQPVPVRRR